MGPQINTAKQALVNWEEMQATLPVPIVHGSSQRVGDRGSSGRQVLLLLPVGWPAAAPKLLSAAKLLLVAVLLLTTPILLLTTILLATAVLLLATAVLLLTTAAVLRAVLAVRRRRRLVGRAPGGRVGVESGGAALVVGRVGGPGGCVRFAPCVDGERGCGWIDEPDRASDVVQELPTSHSRVAALLGGVRSPRVPRRRPLPAAPQRRRPTAQVAAPAAAAKDAAAGVAAAARRVAKAAGRRRRP